MAAVLEESRTSSRWLVEYYPLVIKGKQQAQKANPDRSLKATRGAPCRTARHG
ncbi:hypothetical protein PVAP13_3KG062800 [Panicum virgatum]|uniref:Uncharacterized protein n=1 Tax=Panicum virgatum TaxID=38727 RepID=A0A8T0URN0_PANVG|nr:hypothetical protein PVAP13_3KG062800 [Panicum virgatum]